MRNDFDKRREYFNCSILRSRCFNIFASSERRKNRQKDYALIRWAF